MKQYILKQYFINWITSLHLLFISIFMRYTSFQINYYIIFDTGRFPSAQDCALIPRVTNDLNISGSFDIRLYGRGSIREQKTRQNDVFGSPWGNGELLFGKIVRRKVNYYGKSTPRIKNVLVFSANIFHWFRVF